MKISDFFKKLFRKEVKVNLIIPTAWESVTDAEFREICSILSIPGMDRDRALFLILCSLTHIRPDNPDKYDPKAIKGKMPFIINGQQHIIKASDIAEACRQLSFITDTVGPAPCPLKDVDRMLYNVPFQAFYEADSYIQRYAQDPNGTYLKTAAKSLTDGRIRKLLPWQRIGLVMWWNGLKATLMTMYPYVLKQSDSVTTKTQAQLLQDLLSCLNQDKPQDNEKILKTDTHSVLHTLNKIYYDAERRVSK